MIISYFYTHQRMTTAMDKTMSCDEELSALAATLSSALAQVLQQFLVLTKSLQPLNSVGKLLGVTLMRLKRTKLYTYEIIRQLFLEFKLIIFISCIEKIFTKHTYTQGCLCFKHDVLNICLKHSFKRMFKRSVFKTYYVLNIV